MSPKELVSAAKSDRSTCIVKTHEHPITDDPCIFVVRDGRSSIVSYFHFLNEIARTPVSLEQVIKGEVFAGSWSDHYIAWQPKIRAHTLLLRYEMIVADPNRAIRAISSFLRIKPSDDFCVPFEALRSINSKFFRSGNDEKNIRELDDLGSLFWNHHRPVMLDLGYGHGDWKDGAIPARHDDY
ncbi:UNVERIFIED_ORG: hypothetical protein ABIC72_002667 [Burkholderia sp. 1988]|nr:hypothetical protein [Paraburkholderia terricola]